MKKTELIERMSYEAGFLKTDTEKVLNAFITIVTQAVRDGDKVIVSGLGSFERSERSARTGINPATGEKIEIKAKNAPKFKAAKAFKEFVA